MIMAAQSWNAAYTPDEIRASCPAELYVHVDDTVPGRLVGIASKKQSPEMAEKVTQYRQMTRPT